MSWRVDRADQALHVLPIGDHRPHQLAPDCPCRPRGERGSRGTLLYTHNAWDGREITERAIAALGGRNN